MCEPFLSYNPAKNITLPCLGTVELRGLILIVGPNSSGKTQFLHDIRAAITGQNRKPVVCQSISIEPPSDLDMFITQLDHNRCVKTFHEHGNEWVEIKTWVLGASEKIDHNKTPKQQIAHWYNQFMKPQEQRNFMQFFGRLLVTSLFMQNRLDIANPSNAFDHTKEVPKTDLQVLHTNSDGQRDLNTEFVRAFGKSLSIDSSTNHLRLKVFDEPESDPPRCWVDKTNNMPIEQEGDGIRSFAAICVSLLAGHRPVCLIDEPESCLHPPQAHALGQFIGKHGSCPSRTTLVSTHTSHVLRGIVESADCVQIIRLSRSGRAFVAHSIDYNTLMESINKPIVRTETVLDGVFADGVIVVESDGDRAVYQKAIESSQHEGRFDICFVPAGGHGGIPSVSTFYKRLRIPVATIIDLDIVLEKTLLGNVLIAMAPEKQSQMLEVIQKCEQVEELIMRLPPNLDIAEMQSALRTLFDNNDWINTDRITLIQQLRRAANKLDRKKVVKAGGISAFREHSEIEQLLIEIINACREFGVFLVPVGELEYWNPELMSGVGKQNKAEWANEAVKRIHAAPNLATDLMDFVHGIVKILELERNRSASEDRSL